MAAGFLYVKIDVRETRCQMQLKILINYFIKDGIQKNGMAFL